jgi:hypothetical protein
MKKGKVFIALNRENCFRFNPIPSHSKRFANLNTECRQLNWTHKNPNASVVAYAFYFLLLEMCRILKQLTNGPPCWFPDEASVSLM